MIFIYRIPFNVRSLYNSIQNKYLIEYANFDNE